MLDVDFVSSPWKFAVVLLVVLQPDRWLPDGVSMVEYDKGIQNEGNRMGRLKGGP